MTFCGCRGGQWDGTDGEIALATLVRKRLVDAKRLQLGFCYVDEHWTGAIQPILSAYLISISACTELPQVH